MTAPAVLDAQIEALLDEVIGADDLAARYRHPDLAARIESRGVAWARTQCACEIAAAHAQAVCS